jgi:hypothetical protein
MARFNRKSSPKTQRRSRPTLASAAPVDFGPMLPFLRERVGEDHPIFTAALDGNLSNFMAAIRASGDAKIEHEIASELERMSQPLERT